MSTQLQLFIPDNAQWSAIEGTYDATANRVVVSAPVGWRKLYAFRVQLPAAAAGVLTGYVEFQYVQNSIERLPTNADPYRVPVTNDTEIVMYEPPNPALNLQFIIQDLRNSGAHPSNGDAVRLFILHTLTPC